jgi:membrane-bound lytic murein transglycosylase B
MIQLKSMEIRKTRFIIFLLMAFMVAGVLGYSGHLAKADTANEIQDKLDSLNKKFKDAQQELTTQQSQLYKNTSQISMTQGLLRELQADIARSEAELNNLNDRSKLNKKILEEYIRQMYYANQDNPFVSLAILDGDLNDLTINFDGMAGMKTKISNVLQEINDAKGETEEAKALLASQKLNNQKALDAQKTQQAAISDNIQETQITLAEIQQKMSKLRSTLSGFLGESFSMDDVIKEVTYASKKTGVRKEFLFAVLDKETDLGRYTGGCTYQNTRVKEADKIEFKKICESLGYDYKKKKISCAGSGGYGGAMGVAQFMPTTWVGYKSKIASTTGNSPADPWNLTDGVIGMALKLKAAGAGSKSGERSAAMIYYCGTSHPTETYKGRVASCNNYADTVKNWSKGYDDYFK